jgi:hypothetical protein
VDITGVPQLLDGAVTNADREWLNYPAHMWNAGADVILSGRHTLNTNVRGWHQMRIVAPFTSANAFGYDTLGGEIYLDANLLTKDLLPGADVRISAMNMLDNTGAVGMVINNGVFHPRGRSLGIQLTKRF